MLVRHLPEDSAVHRATTGADSVWTLDRQLAALLADRLSELVWYQAVDHTGKKRKTPTPPEPIDRPGTRRHRPTRTRVPFTPEERKRIGAKRKIWEVVNAS